MNTFLLISGIIFMSAAIVLTYKPLIPAAVVAYLGLILMYFTPAGRLAFTGNTMVFWGVATVIVLGIAYLLPPQVQRTTAGMSFIATGALAGAIVGLILSHAAMIVGSAVGVVFGMVAFTRTPAGNRLRIPSQPAMQYMCCKGLPAIVTMSMVGMVIAALINYHAISQ